MPCAPFSRNGAPEAFLYAFDLLELDGRDLRNEPWARRRALLVQLLADGDAGIRLNEHIEDVDGAVVFRQACVMGSERIVAKRRDRPYKLGRTTEW
jgi:bifunctional non-homologous end joining protein LigD